METDSKIKGFRINRSKIEYMRCEFNDVWGQRTQMLVLTDKWYLGMTHFDI
jgi:hypothetical protein